jgi:hypothetical protein
MSTAEDHGHSALAAAFQERVQSLDHGARVVAEGAVGGDERDLHVDHEHRRPGRGEVDLDHWSVVMVVMVVVAVLVVMLVGVMLGELLGPGLDFGFREERALDQQPLE